MDSWHYEPTADFGQDPIERLKNFPRQPDLLVYAARSLANLAIRVILRTYNRLEVMGRENLPASGSFAIVANHSSHLDTAAVLASLPLSKIHRAFPAAASDYSRLPGTSSFSFPKALGQSTGRSPASGRASDS